MSKRKKIILLSCMVALLAVTALFNFVFTEPALTTQNALSSSANYFAQYRSERASTRNAEILQLDAVIASSSAGSAERNEALSTKTKLSQITEREMLLECLIKAYGFEDAVVVMSLDSDNINVIAKSKDLTTDDAITIYTILKEEVSASTENVKIIPIS